MTSNDYTNPADGSRVIMFDTPCGFEITLMRLAGGELKMGAHFRSEPVSLTNSQYRLSRQGAQLLSQKLAELYA